MNLKQSLLSTIILSIFITGCSSSQIIKENEMKNEAVYQKTMTKVQNDVNEIMNKDYEYVLNNMGQPYCTTYYINSKQIDSDEILNKNLNFQNMRLVYPKHTDERRIQESAICIDIKNNKVIEVTTYELSDLNTEEGSNNQNADIILNKYDNDTSLTLDNLIKSNFRSYIGKDKNKIKNIVGETLPNCEIYVKRKDINIKIYFLSGINEDNGKILGIFEKKNKIINTQIINKNDLSLIKSYLS